MIYKSTVVTSLWIVNLTLVSCTVTVVDWIADPRCLCPMDRLRLEFDSHYTIYKTCDLYFVSL